MSNIVIFASGNGSNAEVIIKHFENNPKGKVKLVVTNNPNAKVIEKSQKLSVPVLVLNNKDFSDSSKLIEILKNNETDLIVLAGFLRKIDEKLLSAFEDKVINIHPSLLPKYGGKGFYGTKVHEAVLKAKEKVTGITIHYVNENYDEGDIKFQIDCEVDESDDVVSLSKKVSQLEHKFYPIIIEKTIENIKKGISLTRSATAPETIVAQVAANIP